ncbi:MAG: uroporphyrinogen decarboxylase family protein, partial [Desulfobacterales bacterium]|nr:uroporphyrinogen decarboxylase family protein [Desulfobacterales bacterium]
MKHNIDEWRYNILRSNSRVAMPIMTHPGIELINSTVQEAVTCGETHFKALEVLYQKYPTAAVTMIMDLTVEAEAFGCKINFEEDDIPNVADRLISEVGEIDNLTVPNISESARLSEYLKASKLAVQNIKDVPVFPGCIGPFSLAGRLIDMSEIMVDIYLYPDSIHNLLQKCTAFIKEYISAYKALGTNGIVIAEPAAGLLGNDECSQFSSDYIKDIVDEFQDDDFLIILHNCGHEGGLTQTMVETGVKALHL